jgi:hypothetical protein
MAGKHGRSGPPGNDNGLQHGLYSMKRTLMQLGNRAIDGRSSLGQALKKWRGELISDLGGEGNISTQQITLVDICVKTKLMLDSVDVWLLSRPNLINQRKQSVLPAVIQRQQLADGLSRYLNQLGMERRHKLKTLSDILSEADEPEPVHTNGKAVTEPDPSDSSHE